MNLSRVMRPFSKAYTAIPLPVLPSCWPRGSVREAMEAKRCLPSRPKASSVTGPLAATGQVHKIVGRTRNGGRGKLGGRTEIEPRRQAADRTEQPLQQKKDVRTQESQRTAVTLGVRFPGPMSVTMRARFDQPTVSDGNEKHRGDQRAQMGLSTIKRSDESSSPDDDWHGLGNIGFFLGVENRNGKESQQCAK